MTMEYFISMFKSRHSHTKTVADELPDDAVIFHSEFKYTERLLHVFLFSNIKGDEIIEGQSIWNIPINHASVFYNLGCGCEK